MLRAIAIVREKDDGQPTAKSPDANVSLLAVAIVPSKCASNAFFLLVRRH